MFNSFGPIEWQDDRPLGALLPHTKLSEKAGKQLLGKIAYLMKNDVGKTSPGRAEGRQPCIKRQIPRRIIFHAERRNIRVKEQIARAFHADKPILAMLHLGGYNPNEVHDRAKREIEQLYENGVDAILAEDYFGSPDDVEWALDYLSANWPERVYGLNLLSDPEKGFRLAMRYGAAFMQIDSVCGHLRPGVHMKGDGIPNLYAKTCDGDFADRLAELRAAYPVFLLGGVRFKYQPVRSGRSVEEDLALGRERCDAVVVTGEGTGMNTGIEKIRRFRQALGDFPLFVGAGVTAATCREQLSIADGAIVGSWFKQEGKTEAPVDAERVRQFMKIVQEARCMEK